MTMDERRAHDAGGMGVARGIGRPQGAISGMGGGLAVVSVPATGWAATYGSAGISSFPTLHVVGNSKDYTDVTESTYEWKGFLELDAKGFALIQGWSLHPSLKWKDGQSWSSRSPQGLAIPTRSVSGPPSSRCRR